MTHSHLSPSRAAFRVIALLVVITVAAPATRLPPVPGPPVKAVAAAHEDEEAAFAEELPPCEEMNGASLNVWLGRTNLRYGEPVEIIIRTTDPSKKGPFVRRYMSGERANTQINLTTE